MSVTLEQVERLRERAEVSYEEARAALEQSGGDLLEALILLERQGKTRGGGQTGAFYTTRPGGDVPPAPHLPTTPPPPKGGREKRTGEAGTHPGFWAQVQRLLKSIWNVVRHSLTNQFEVWRGEEMTTSMPVLILIILLCVFWITIPVLIVGLFFGCRYRFSGPDLNREKVSQVMETINTVANDVVDTVKAEFHKATDDKKDNKS